MKRIFSLFLTLVLCAGLCAALGVSASADDDAEVKEVTLNVNNPEVDGVKVTGQVRRNGQEWCLREPGDPTVFTVSVEVPELCAILSVTYHCGFCADESLPPSHGVPNVSGYPVAVRHMNCTVNISGKDNVRRLDANGVSDGNIDYTQSVESVTVRYCKASVYPEEVNEAITESADLPDGYYIIHSALNWDYCLDISGGAAAMGNEANLHLWPFGTAEAKIFELEKDENKGAYIIRAVHSQKILDVLGFDSAPGANIMQWDDDGADDQRWIFEYADDEGNFYIRTLQNGYMDVKDGTAGQDANVYCEAFSGEDSQKWMLEGYVYEELVNGSTLSQGSVWIIAAIAAAAVIAVGAIVVVKKKRVES